MAVALIGVALAGPTSATADSIDDQKRAVDAQIAALKDSLEGANADFVAAAVAVRTSEVKLAIAQDALRTAKRQVRIAQAKDDELTAQLEVAQAEAAKAQREIDATAQAQQQTRAELGRIAARAYTGTRLTGLAIALDAATPQQFVDQMSAARAALRAQGVQIDLLAVQQSDLRARNTELAAAKAQVAELERQAAIVLQQKQDAQDAAAAAEAEVASALADQKVALAAIQTKIAAEKARLDALSAEQSKLQAVLVARAKAAAEAYKRAHQGQNAGGGGGTTTGGGFLSYAASGPITSGFGMRYHPILHISRMHTGIDFGVPCGTPVHAAADGDVISAGWAGGYGNRIVIDHGMVRGVDLATTYNHLSSISAWGGHVSRGQLIGYSGTTGLSTGCHLHFETLVNGEFVNPMNWL